MENVKLVEGFRPFILDQDVADKKRTDDDIEIEKFSTPQQSLNDVTPQSFSRDASMYIPVPAAGWYYIFGDSNLWNESYVTVYFKSTNGPTSIEVFVSATNKTNGDLWESSHRILSLSGTRTTAVTLPWGNASFGIYVRGLAGSSGNLTLTIGLS